MAYHRPLDAYEEYIARKHEREAETQQTTLEIPYVGFAENGRLGLTKEPSKPLRAIGNVIYWFGVAVALAAFPVGLLIAGLGDYLKNRGRGNPKLITCLADDERRDWIASRRSPAVNSSYVKGWDGGPPQPPPDTSEGRRRADLWRKWIANEKYWGRWTPHCYY